MPLRCRLAVVLTCLRGPPDRGYGPARPKLEAINVEPPAPGPVAAGLLPRFDGAESILLATAMLGATVTSMDAGLNKGVGVFVRSLYKPLFRPQASEKHLLVTGKICTATICPMNWSVPMAPWRQAFQNPAFVLACFVK